MKKKKEIEKICNNCLCFNKDKKECKVAVLLEGKEYHLPVLPGDKCHFDDLGIEIIQVIWWVEDDDGNPTDKDGTVKMEDPADFFGTNENILKEL